MTLSLFFQAYFFAFIYLYQLSVLKYQIDRAIAQALSQLLDLLDLICGDSFGLFVYWRQVTHFLLL